ncbi:hypothetical protein [Streptomyces sp. SID13031]|uniref:hypothetical protein n=1 Tax=Streptomyces sp. SID13031 TaxID=2706046 RepID=UPI001944E06A|nr:hypothetical protein [Streptomyces sp. SID13031]
MVLDGKRWELLGADQYRRTTPTRLLRRRSRPPWSAAPNAPRGRLRVAAHQHFVERRRATRPGGELRTATGEEWAEFENRFLLRKIALGDCHRPYGAACVHEHAC